MIDLAEFLKLKPNVMTMKAKKDSDLQKALLDYAPWATSLGEAIYCLRNKITERPMCKYKDCKNPAPFRNTDKMSYSNGCCEDHAMKYTILSKYGVESPSQLQSVRDKMHETLMANMEKHGVTNPADLPGYKESRSQKMLERYGTTKGSHTPNAKKSQARRVFNKWVGSFGDMFKPLFDIDQYNGSQEEYRWKCNTCGYEFVSTATTSFRDTPVCPVCKPKTSSVGEQELADYVRSVIPDITCNTRRVIAPKELDIYIPSKTLAIEYNGLYWHGDTDHTIKLNLCKNEGIDLLQFFEDEWVKKQDIVKSMISSKLGMNHKIYARKCKVVDVSHDVSTHFFNENHIQGSVRSTTRVGLEFDGELVCCASFGKSRYSSKAEWELLRFASKKNITVVGGMSRILKYFRSQHQGKILSYADRRYSSGNSYLQCGFKLSHITTPGYSYYKCGYLKRLNRQSFQKHLLKDLLDTFDPAKTEIENMKVNGYLPIYDCGQMVFILD